MAGIQEILTLILLIALLLFIPRLFKKGDPPGKKIKKSLYVSGKMRLAIVLSGAVPLAAGIFFKPWGKDFLVFLTAGVLPVAAGWAGFWIYKGFKSSDVIK